MEILADRLRLAGAYVPVRRPEPRRSTRFVGTGRPSLLPLPEAATCPDIAPQGDRGAARVISGRVDGIIDRVGSGRGEPSVLTS